MKASLLYFLLVADLLSARGNILRGLEWGAVEQEQQQHDDTDEQTLRHHSRQLGSQDNIFKRRGNPNNMMMGTMMMGKKGMTGMMMGKNSSKKDNQARRRKPTPSPPKKPVPVKPVPQPSGGGFPDQPSGNKDQIIQDGIIYNRRGPPPPTPFDPASSPSSAPSEPPSESPKPSPSPSARPSAVDQSATSAPSDSPKPSPSPSSFPTESPQPSSSPTESPAPSPAPSFEIDGDQGPSATPSDSPKPSPAPSSFPTESHEPSSSPTESPAPSPAPSINIDQDRCAAVSCPAGQSCDPIDGTCKANNALRPCIAVIDESNQTDSFINATWFSFRAQFPTRPFCLLQPQIPPTTNNRLYRPPAFESDVRTTYANVARDNGNTAQASDWAGICDISGLAITGIDYVALFIDTSGSMTLSTVWASYTQFQSDLTAAGLTFRSVQNTDEDWITPFIVDLN